MNRLISCLAALAAACLAQGCATRHPTQHAAAKATSLQATQHTEVATQQDAPSVPGHPLTSVVVTQCNLIVAVYMTMSDGSLLRFDSSAQVPADQLLQMAYTAIRSERVEVSCNGPSGAVGYEKHDPV